MKFDWKKTEKKPFTTVECRQCRQCTDTKNPSIRVMQDNQYCHFVSIHFFLPILSLLRRWRRRRLMLRLKLLFDSQMTVENGNFILHFAHSAQRTREFLNEKKKKFKFLLFINFNIKQEENNMWKSRHSRDTDRHIRHRRRNNMKFYNFRLQIIYYYFMNGTPHCECVCACGVATTVGPMLFLLCVLHYYAHCGHVMRFAMHENNHKLPQTHTCNMFYDILTTSQHSSTNQWPCLIHHTISINIREC